MVPTKIFLRDNNVYTQHVRTRIEDQWVRNAVLRTWLPRLRRYLAGSCWERSCHANGAEQRNGPVRSGSEKWWRGRRTLTEESNKCLLPKERHCDDHSELLHLVLVHNVQPTLPARNKRSLFNTWMYHIFCVFNFCRGLLPRYWLLHCSGELE